MGKARESQVIRLTRGELKAAIREVIEETLTPVLRSRPRLLKVSEAASFLKLSNQAIWDKIGRGQLKAQKTPGFPTMVELPAEIAEGRRA